MSDPRLHVQGLRCFRDRLELPLSDGICALVGLNNSGKSSLLRLPWELRPVFVGLSRGLQNFAMNTPPGPFARG